MDEAIKSKLDAKGTELVGGYCADAGFAQRSGEWEKNVGDYKVTMWLN